MIQDEYDDLGMETYRKSEELIESITALRAGNRRVKAAEKRLSNGNRKILHARKKSKAKGTEGL